MNDITFVPEQQKKLGARSLEAEQAGKKGHPFALINGVLAVALVIVAIAWFKGDLTPAAPTDEAGAGGAVPQQADPENGRERGKTDNLRDEIRMTAEQIREADPDPPTFAERNSIVVGEVHWTAKNPAVRINHRLHTVGDRVIGVDDDYHVVHIQRSRVYLKDPAGKLVEFPTGVHRTQRELEMTPLPGPDDKDVTIGNIPGVDD